jgi:hypothetical protein
MIRWNWLICIVILILPFSLLAESELLLNGSTYVAFSSKRPDLSLGFGYSYQATKQFRLSCNLNYSFRHQIAASDDDFPIAFVFIDDSSRVRVDEYIIDSYREKGYCFSLNLIPEYVINQLFFGAGIGLEFGSYTPHYTHKIKGQPDLAIHLPEVSRKKDNNLIFLFLVGYEVYPIKTTVSFIWKRFKNAGIGINLGWGFWKSK